MTSLTERKSQMRRGPRRYNFEALVRCGIVLLASLAASEASAADDFDLVCITTKFNKPAVTSRYSISLIKGEWCLADKCEQTSKEIEATETTITIKIFDVSASRNLLSSRVQIDRSTGRIVEQFGMNNSWTFVAQGTCEPAPFTGFPAKKF